MCLTCAKCYEVCPQEVDIPEFVRLSRVDTVIDEKSYAHHNVFNLVQIFMAEMTEKGMEFNYEGEIDPNSNIAYFPGCIDLFDRFLDLEKSKTNSKNKVIVIKEKTQKIGFLIDDVYEIINIPNEKFINTSKMDKNSFLLADVLQDDGKVLSVLDVNKILENEKLIIEDAV